MTPAAAACWRVRARVHPAAGGSLFGASAPRRRAVCSASAPATGGGGLFGASAPATGGGGLFGAGPPGGGRWFIRASAPATAGGLFGASAPATGGGGLFGASAPATGGGGLFGASTGHRRRFVRRFDPGHRGGLPGAPAPAAGALVPAGSLAGAQPAGSVLSTTDGQPVKHFTQWGELAPASQENLRALETRTSRRARIRNLDGAALPPRGSQRRRRETPRRAERSVSARRIRSNSSRRSCGAITIAYRVCATPWCPRSATRNTRRLACSV